MQGMGASYKRFSTGRVFLGWIDTSYADHFLETIMKVGTRVYDSWWPIDRRGVVTKLSARGCVVRWLDGTNWRYDRAHMQFLRVD